MTDDKSNALTSYMVGLLQAQGMRCLVDKQHVVVSADPGKLKTQASQTGQVFDGHYKEIIIF